LLSHVRARIINALLTLLIVLRVLLLAFNPVLEMGDSI